MSTDEELSRIQIVGQGDGGFIQRLILQWEAPGVFKDL